MHVQLRALLEMLFDSQSSLLCGGPSWVDISQEVPGRLDKWYPHSLSKEADFVVCETLLKAVYKPCDFLGAKFNHVPESESSPGDQQEVMLVGKRN